MEIITCKPSEFDTKELAAFMYQVRRAEIDSSCTSLADLENNLENVWHFIGYVLAHSEGNLIGYALLFRIGESDLIEINPGAIMGQHPIVAPGFDEEVIVKGMIEAAKEYVLHEGFKSIYIDIICDPTAPPETYNVYRDRYGALGFEVIQHVREMNISLPANVPATEIPLGMQLDQIQSVDEEALYQCHHQAYMQNKAQYYFQMDDQERRENFKHIYAPNIREHPASLVLTSGDQIVGCVMLFAEGDFTEVMSLAVHPDFRRQGYGKLLMRECLKRAAEEGHRTMYLRADVNDEGVAELYRQCGFKDTSGYLTFKWKA